jgi:LysR family nitrogen assimilation transcriptional regulator
MNFRQLRYFVAIVDRGSLNKAADSVFVAQPCLSQQVAALEQELKVQLLIRNARGAVPTSAGRILYRHAVAVLRQLDTARQEVRDPTRIGQHGLVAIGLPPTVASNLAFLILQAMRAQHSGIRVHVLEADTAHLVELLSRGQLDMSVHFRGAETPLIAQHFLFEEGFFVVGNVQRSLPEKTCSLAELSGVPLMLPSKQEGLRLLVERSFADAGLELNIVAEVDALPTLIMAVAAGLATTILPWLALPMDFHKHYPVRLIVEPEIRRPVSLCWLQSVPQTQASELARQIIDQVVDEVVGNGQQKSIRRRPGTSSEAKRA